MPNLYKNLWVLVDKRNQILEADALCPTKEVAGIPLETFWCNRSSARHQLKKIRSKMGKECWNTWKFRIAKYKLEK